MERASRGRRRSAPSSAVAKTRCKLEPKYQSRFLSKRTFVSLTLPRLHSPRTTLDPTARCAGTRSPDGERRASFTEMLSLISAFVFSHRTAKRDGEGPREGGKLSSASASSSLGQRGNADESLSMPSEAPFTRISPHISKDHEH